ncbi:MAG: substrate-binding domain-containing protein [Candidatus Methylomirabilales bacterium]
MRRTHGAGFSGLLTSLLLLLALSSGVQAAEGRLRLSTTTSTENSGLLAVLIPPFEAQFGLKVDVIPVGTGKALRLAEGGDVDITLVHAPELEEPFVKDGFGVNRRYVMYNDFVIVGPSHDPAGIRGISDAKVAFQKIAAGNAPFISRGDRSGTHTKELRLWQKTGLHPSLPWYLEAGRGMGAVLVIADQKRAYTLTDRGTYLAFQRKLDLPILVEGDPALFNPYHVIAVNPAIHPHVNYLGAMLFIGWLTSPAGQKIITRFGREEFGQPLFIPAAIPHQ